MLTSNMQFSSDQLDQLKALGLDISNPLPSISNDIKNDHILAPNLGQISTPPVVSTRYLSLLPLLSISGLSLISFGGLLLFKSKADVANTPPNLSGQSTPQVDNVPTQVPKSIQHYLLASQQYFSQALTSQNNQAGSDPNRNNSLAELLNQSILAATAAIKDFPTDFRGYQQRGSIYMSLVDSQPQFLDSAITDFSRSSELNPASAEISRSLATLFAKKGDANMTLTYLARTVAIEPTKAQNFYDLARLQQQTGLISQAVDTYSKLLPLITDTTQKQQVKTELSSLEKLTSQSTSNPTLNYPSVTPNPPTGGISLPDQPNLIQANTNQGLIIAAPETSKAISVSNLSASNALSGNDTLPVNTTSVSIPNSQITPSSQVYLTVTKGGANQSLRVLSRSKDSFTVGIDSPISEAIEFKWWIVN